MQLNHKNLLYVSMSDASTPRITRLYPVAALTQRVTESVCHTHSVYMVDPTVIPHATDKYNFLFKYFNTCTVHLLLFCTMTNKCTIISQNITRVHVTTLSCNPQGPCK